VRLVFTGEYRHTVDEKGRLAIPARFRTELAGGAVLSRWIDGCLAIHTRAGWDELDAKVSAVPITDPAGRLFQRQIFAGALDAELDKQGRVLVPAYLRDEMGIGTDALVIGVRDHGEIWAPDRWQVYRQAMDDPATFAEAIRGLGI
jgi:MraZ protein